MDMSEWLAAKSKKAEPKPAAQHVAAAISYAEKTMANPVFKSLGGKVHELKATAPSEMAALAATVHQLQGFDDYKLAEIIVPKTKDFSELDYIQFATALRQQNIRPSLQWRLFKEHAVLEEKIKLWALGIAHSSTVWYFGLPEAEAKSLVFNELFFMFEGNNPSDLEQWTMLIFHISKAMPKGAASMLRGECVKLVPKGSFDHIMGAESAGLPIGAKKEAPQPDSVKMGVMQGSDHETMEVFKNKDGSISYIPVGEAVMDNSGITLQDAMDVHDADTAEYPGTHVTQLKGVGLVLSMKLKDLGITTIPQLADVDPKMAGEAGIQHGKLVSLKEQAVEWMKEQATAQQVAGPKTPEAEGKALDTLSIKPGTSIINGIEKKHGLPPISPSMVAKILEQMAEHGLSDKVKSLYLEGNKPPTLENPQSKFTDMTEKHAGTLMDHTLAQPNLGAVYIAMNGIVHWVPHQDSMPPTQYLKAMVKNRAQALAVAHTFLEAAKVNVTHFHMGLGGKYHPIQQLHAALTQAEENKQFNPDLLCQAKEVTVEEDFATGKKVVTYKDDDGTVVGKETLDPFSIADFFTAVGPTHSSMAVSKDELKAMMGEAQPITSLKPGNLTKKLKHTPTPMPKAPTHAEKMVEYQLKAQENQQKQKLKELADEEAEAISGPKSQKAKGVLYAAKHVSSSTGLNPLAATVWRPGDPVPQPFPKFARPCPMTPRHGFVDSRLVKNVDDWNKLIADIKKSDEPNCEVLLMQPMIGPCSSIITPAGIVVGPGNDGATSGHESLSVPVSVEPGKLWGVLHGNTDGKGKRAMSSVGIKDTPYVETVTGPDKKTYVVQIRDGPKVELTMRRVDHQHRVTEVIMAGGDLLEWEETARQLAKKLDKYGNSPDGKPYMQGPVVYHPGGSMSSHYAVHCVINKVPIIIDEKPEVGQILEPTKNAPELVAKDYEHIAASFQHFTRKVKGWVDHVDTEDDSDDDVDIDVEFKGGHYELRDIARFGIGVLHSQHMWGNAPHLLTARGAGIAWLLALGQAACAGEDRHFTNFNGGYPLTAKMIPQGGERGKVFMGTFRLEPVHRGITLKCTLYDYLCPGWINKGGYGGKKWADCARATMRLGRDASRFCLNPGAETYKQLVESYNVMVNLVHNGGKFLNKFLPGSDFDYIAAVPSIAFAGTVAFDTFQVRREKMETMSMADLKKLEEAHLMKKNEDIVALAQTVPELDLTKPKATAAPIAKPKSLKEANTDNDEFEEEGDAMAKAVEMLQGIGGPTDGQFKKSNSKFIHVQVPCSPGINRQYGLAIDVPMSQVIGDVDKALKDPPEGNPKNGSLAGTGSLYTLCSVYAQNGKMMVDVSPDKNNTTPAA